MIIYLIITFLVTYFAIKKWSDEMLKKVKTSKYREWADTPEFWYIVLTIVFWPVVVPGYFLWKLMDKITNKIKKKDEESL